MSETSTLNSCQFGDKLQRDHKMGTPYIWHTASRGDERFLQDTIILWNTPLTKHRTANKSTIIKSYIVPTMPERSYPRETWMNLLHVDPDQNEPPENNSVPPSIDSKAIGLAVKLSAALFALSDTIESYLAFDRRCDLTGDFLTANMDRSQSDGKTPAACDISTFFWARSFELHWLEVQASIARVQQALQQVERRDEYYPRILKDIARLILGKLYQLRLYLDQCIGRVSHLRSATTERSTVRDDMMWMCRTINDSKERVDWEINQSVPELEALFQRMSIVDAQAGTDS